jgi:hypothetical protein
VPCSASRVVPGAHRVVGPGTHRCSGPREVHTTQRDSEEHLLAVTPTPTFQLYDDIRSAISSCPELSALRNNIVAGLKDPSWCVQDGLIFRSGKIHIPPQSELLQHVIQIAHTGGHEGIQKTLHRLRAHFHIDYDRRLVTEFVRTCVTCQQNKSESL